jgi:ABC-type histidine transport system ATPase subunit
MADIKLRNIVKRYGNTEVIHGVDLGYCQLIEQSRVNLTQHTSI